MHMYIKIIYCSVSRPHMPFVDLISRPNVVCTSYWCIHWHRGEKQWAISCPSNYCWWAGQEILFYSGVQVMTSIKKENWEFCFTTLLLSPSIVFYGFFALMTASQVTKSSDTRPGSLSPQEQATINAIVTAR